MFVFQAEDGIRDIGVTGVQTCALPIYQPAALGLEVLQIVRDRVDHLPGDAALLRAQPLRLEHELVPASLDGGPQLLRVGRSEERRVGKECRSRWSPYHSKNKTHKH